MYSTVQSSSCRHIYTIFHTLTQAVDCNRVHIHCNKYTIVELNTETILEQDRVVLIYNCFNTRDEIKTLKFCVGKHFRTYSKE